MCASEQAKGMDDENLLSPAIPCHTYVETTNDNAEGMAERTPRSAGGCMLVVLNR